VRGESAILWERVIGSTPDFEDTVQLQRVASTLSICFLFTISGYAQAGGGRPTSPGSHGSPGMPVDAISNPGANEEQQRAAREMAKKANLERQAAIKADTDKLLKLAEELKQSVDKSSANVLSIDVLKKAEEIEKLAHSVKDKMRGTN
jgi:hypothetical protein